MLRRLNNHFHRGAFEKRFQASALLHLSHFYNQRYRRLTKKTTIKTMIRRPKEPGQTNQPPPLEYPATKHPDSPRVTPDAATSAASRVSKDGLKQTLCRFSLRTPSRSYAPARLRSELQKPESRSDSLQYFVPLQQGIRHACTSDKRPQTRKLSWRKR